VVCLRSQVRLAYVPFSLVTAIGLALAGCSGSDPEADSSETGGAPADTGGTSATGGDSGTPVNPTGGSAAVGGGNGTGGLSASGGSASTGGAPASGGGTATGGAGPGTGGSAADGGASTGGFQATGGNAATGGDAATGGNSATGGDSATGGAGTGGDTSSCSEEELDFSFFVTSLEGLRRDSGSQDGYGAKLGGLDGADAICQRLAEYSTPCAAKRQWHAFLSTVAGPVHAKDRIGVGPWYDRIGRTVALTLTDLLNSRPVGADAEIANDLPNEFGVPNHDPDGTGQVDNHDTLTGTGPDGNLFSNDSAYTCKDWTSDVGTDGTPHCGHTWPTGGGGGGRPGGGGTTTGTSMSNWMSALDEAGCAPADTATSLIEAGGPKPNIRTVGSGGGYGAFYCFAVTP
jgi:hypothetical protein